jgi:cytochrome c oxidase subunit 1
MGAVFAIFAGWYYWIGKITGNTYPEVLGKIHFWTTFIGVNLTFFPMHFLGLAGMPRRIPDFPDAFHEWNTIASFGSFITLVSTVFFAYVVYVTFTANERVGYNPWRNVTSFQAV